MEENDFFPETVEIEITDSFDLHSFAPKDIPRIVEEYLMLAREKGFRVVRIIHGKGIGVQREIVRSILAKTPFVESFKDAPAFSGHWGATVVQFK
ncbi:MAG TPA: Smr/MutS family protein [Pyrinomonadaceae bacterium]|jgi:dsDNA-specific endonuclease/ATPase MutS2